MGNINVKPYYISICVVSYLFMYSSKNNLFQPIKPVMLIIYHIIGLVQHDFIKSETLLGFEGWTSLHCLLEQNIAYLFVLTTRNIISSETLSHVKHKKRKQKGSCYDRIIFWNKIGSYLERCMVPQKVIRPRLMNKRIRYSKYQKTLGTKRLGR